MIRLKAEATESGLEVRTERGTWNDGWFDAMPALPSAPLERAACLALLAFAAALQLSIAAADILLTIAALLWARPRRSATTSASKCRGCSGRSPPTRRRRSSRRSSPSTRASAWSTPSSSSCSIIVPLTYRLFRGRRALLAVDVIITIGAISATWGIVQYLILNFDHLGRRPQGALGLYMTYSGLLMLVACAAVSRVMFAKHHRAWAALVLPALLLALVFTFTRSAWVGACVGIGLLFLLRDFRLMGLLPVALGGVPRACAPASLTTRLYSTFSLKDPSNVDRVAMMKSGLPHHQGRPADRRRARHGHPGLSALPRQERGQPAQPAPAQRAAADRGGARPAGARASGSGSSSRWCAISCGAGDPTFPSLSNAGLAVIGAMLAAGLFEYNFGDSEFLMLFLVLVTLPYAAERAPVAAAAPLPHARRAD